ncbi:hypothetical protein HDV62DRAFT_252905 [Trichoderma sp. SZMC 28011]
MVDHRQQNHQHALRTRTYTIRRVKYSAVVFGTNLVPTSQDPPCKTLLSRAYSSKRGRSKAHLRGFNHICQVEAIRLNSVSTGWIVAAAPESRTARRRIHPTLAQWSTRLWAGLCFDCATHSPHLAAHYPSKQTTLLQPASSF